jgi:hypothetical protein
MRPDDKDKLNKCLEILDTTDLGLSMVWLWTWSTIKGLMEDQEYKFTKSEDEVWDLLSKAVAEGYGFSLEYGAEQHYEDIKDWLINNEIIIDLMFADDEDLTDDDQDEIIKETHLEEIK